MRRFIAMTALAGLAVAFIAALVVQSGKPIAIASSVQVYVAGDTLSLISGTAQDTTFKSPYDCCQVFASSLADTSRPINVFGAEHVDVKVMGCDTCFACTVHMTGLQFSDDSVYWVASGIAGTDGTFDILVDTTTVDIGVVSQGFSRASSGGGLRAVKISPAYNDMTANKIPNGIQRIPHKWMRMIFATKPNFGAAKLGPNLSPCQVTLKAYVSRDDIGDAMQPKKTGR